MQPPLSRQDFHPSDSKYSHYKGLSTVSKIREALNLMRNQQFEVPFIAFYRKEYIDPELNISDLWCIFQWDEKWMQLRSRKKNLLKLFEQVPFRPPPSSLCLPLSCHQQTEFHFCIQTSFKDSSHCMPSSTTTIQPIHRCTTSSWNTRLVTSRLILPSACSTKRTSSASAMCRLPNNSATCTSISTSTTPLMSSNYANTRPSSGAREGARVRRKRMLLSNVPPVGPCTRRPLKQASVTLPVGLASPLLSLAAT